MNPSARAEAVFSAVAANNPRVARMTAAERDAMRAGMQQVFGADLSYIQANAEVPGAQYSAPSTACVVATATGPASGQTTPATVTGTGKVF